MRITPPRLAILLTTVVFLLLNSSCVYLRLYEMKKQFAAFSKNFELRDEGGITLVFKNPVLLSHDLIWLTKNPPTSKEKTPKGEVWTFLYKKHYRQEATYKAENKYFDIPIVMLLNDKKVLEIKLPERFLNLISKELVAGMFESMGSAKIHKLSRSANSRFAGHGTKPVATMPQVVSVLGKPYHVVKTSDTVELTYNYSIMAEQENRFAKKPDFIMVYKFENLSKRLLKSDVNIRGLNISIDFSQNSKKK